MPRRRGELGGCQIGSGECLLDPDVADLHPRGRHRSAITRSARPWSFSLRIRRSPPAARAGPNSPASPTRQPNGGGRQVARRAALVPLYLGIRSRVRSRSASATADRMVNTILETPLPVVSPPRSIMCRLTPACFSRPSTSMASRALRKSDRVRRDHHVAGCRTASSAEPRPVAERLGSHTPRSTNTCRS